MTYSFDWDPIKAARNLKSHKVNFERATEVFRDPFAVSILDEEHSEQEDRWVTLGKDFNDVILVVIHTFRELSADRTSIRIISARKANKHEIRQYENPQHES